MTSERPSDKRALCLSGGGITGAMYEVGCLAAIEQEIPGFHAGELDVYVGASAGASVALGLAGGYSATRIYRALLDPADDFFPLQRQHLLRFDSMELKRVASSVFGSARRAITSATSRPLAIDLWHEIDRFYDSLPAGLFAVEPYEKFLTDFMSRRGIPPRFADMPKQLAIVANDLDEGRRAVFGIGELSHVQVARAIAASSAVPVLFAPVRIGEHDYVAGGVGGSGHVDVAAELGCDRVLIINAVVPVHAGRDSRVPTGHGPRTRVRDKGMLWVYSQSWRMLSEARLHEGLAAFRADHPGVQVGLLEPDRDDATIFMYSPMNFAARRAILQQAFTNTVRALREERSSLRAMLEPNGPESDAAGRVREG